MDILIGMLITYLTIHFLHYGFSKKTKIKREMDTIDSIINDAIGNKRTPVNRKKNNS